MTFISPFPCQQQSILPTEEEIYDFFTRNFDPEPEEPPKPQDDVPQEDQPGPSAQEADITPAKKAETPRQGTKPGTEEKKDEEKPLLSEFFLDRDNWKDFPTEMKGPEFIALRDREDLEKGYYFIPSVSMSEF